MPWSRRCWVAAVLLVASASPAGGQQPLDATTVLTAIDRGIGYLKREQSAKGQWSDMAGYSGGVTALATLALIHSGVEPGDPVVQRALSYLRRHNPDKTYCVSLKAMVLCAAQPHRDMTAIQECVAWLEAKQIKREGDANGAWSYPKGSGDPSNSQFAVLALHEARQVGARVSPETWRLANAYWRRTQNHDGSWSYAGAGPTGSMTCAGIGALHITSQALNPGDARVVAGRVKCCFAHERDDALDRGLAWLGRNFSVRRNPIARPSALWHYYYLYGVERVGRLSARRFLGEHDWYREGTAYLVQAQDPLSHFWEGRRLSETNPHISTAMALLFLSKGRRPVVMAKFAYGEGWNAHRRDAANLTALTEQAWDLDLSWQIIHPQGVEVEDMLQAPVLYLSGSRTTTLLPWARKLREYVDRGGFLLAESCCGDPTPFREAFGELIEAMFPEPEYRLRQLRPAHPLWRMEKLVRPESPYAGKLWAVEYGCRTSVVFCEEDLSCYWELNRPGIVETYPEQIRRHVQDARDIGLNVLAYATNREPRGKEQSLADAEPSTAIDPTDRRGVIEIAKLRHGGGCNDAPGALANLTRAAAMGEAKIRIDTHAPLISLSDPNLFRFHLAFMHGRHDFRLTQHERTQLRLYLERGGTLLADSICASKAFTSAFRREVIASVGGGRLERIPADDPILTNAFGGYDIRTVTIRDPQPTDADQPLAARSHQIAPQLEGLRIGDRWAVLFSPHDLSCALEKHEAVECRGYHREDAARIGLNVLFYSLNF